MKLSFFVPMIVPTATQQMHKIGVRNGKPYIYEPQALKAARSKLSDFVGPHRPDKPMTGALRLVVKWCFERSGAHRDGEYKTSKPDTDNLNKMLKDVMTQNGFWKDDAQVASEIIEKFYSDIPGLYIEVVSL